MKRPAEPETDHDALAHDAAGALTRRGVLRGLGAAALAPALSFGCDDQPAGAPRFLHGVASGDPLPDAVILWTRVTPAAAASVAVTWEIGTTPALMPVLLSGSVEASAARDYTVKVDVTGLVPGQTYYFRFRAAGVVSPVGRTETAPLGPVARLRFGVASCSSYTQGYFHAYRSLARRAELDAVIHLGDYIYEYGSGQYGTDRAHEPAHEALTLADYRMRHAQYKRDPDLQEVHRQHPFIVVWDDHESANNAWRDGAENHTPGVEGLWAERKAAAQRAYAEWMPLREQADPGRIWRKLGFGELADLVLLDTRLWGRAESTGGLVGATPPADPARSLLGDDQALWLEQQIAGSTARWKLIGQQVMVANLILSPGMIVNPDQWHGYPSARQRLLEALRGSVGGSPGNVVVLTGDIHSSWANELVFDPLDPASYDPTTGAGAVAVEFVTPGITSPGLPPLFLPAVESARPYNPHLRWFDLMRQGYMILDLSPERAEAAWYLYADIKKATPVDETFAAVWSVNAGSTRLVQGAVPTDPPAGAPLAP